MSSCRPTGSPRSIGTTPTRSSRRAASVDPDERCGRGSARPATSRRRGRRSTAGSALKPKAARRSRGRSGGTRCRGSTTRSVSIWPARPSCVGAPTSRSSASSPRSRGIRRSGASCSPSRARAPTWRGSRRELCATATRGSCGVRRCGPAWATSRRSACCSHAPIPTSRSTRESPRSWCRWISPASLVRPLRQITGDPEFTRGLLRRRWRSTTRCAWVTSIKAGRWRSPF